MIDKALLLTLTLSNGADLTTTELLAHKCARTPNCEFKEHNPIMGKHTWQRVIVKAGSTTATYNALKNKSKKRRIIWGAVTVLYNGFIVKHHLNQMRKLDGRQIRERSNTP